jgi:hypothetical protein
MPSRRQTASSSHLRLCAHLATGIFVSKGNIITIYNKACLLSIQIYIKIQELLFLPDIYLLNHNQKNSSHR